MFRLLTQIANPIHTMLLCSPLHRLVSHRMILLTFYGRKSGKQYRFPVYYARSGEDIRFFTSRSGRWWLNLLRGTWVKVRLQGVDYDGIVEHVPASHSRMVDAVMLFDPGLTRREAESLADDKVMFHIRLQPQAEEVRRRVTGIS
jgi:hypothetical protein